MDNLHSAAKEFGFSVMETVTGGKSDTALHARINQTQPEVEGA
jgi:hypothetical protein